MTSARDLAKKHLQAHPQKIRADREQQRADEHHHAWGKTYDAATGRKTHDRAR